MKWAYRVKIFEALGNVQGNLHPLLPSETLPGKPCLANC